MPREIVGKGLRFSLRHASCAHICRYCLISEMRKGSKLPFARFEQLVHRFYDRKNSAGRDDLQIGNFRPFLLENRPKVARSSPNRFAPRGTAARGLA
jgi:hypothetical protein